MLSHLASGHAKTATYAAMHFCVAVTVAFFVTESWVAALGVGLIEPAIQTIAYTLHERVWATALQQDALRKAGFQGARAA